MPIEVRYVMFTQTEVVKAILEFKKRRGEAMPQGSIVKFGMEGTSEPSFIIEIKGDDGIVQTVSVDNKPLTAALVMFCINTKIPLPAKASKTLKVNGQKLALVVEEAPR